jgi:hypothetical protein
MPSYASRIRPYVNRELHAAQQAQMRGDASAAFRHLERAHVLAQPSTVQHLRVHWRMLAWGLRQRRVRECLGQMVRLVGAATKTGIGLVPAGNTGGAGVSPFRRMPVPPDLAAHIAQARREAR